MGRSVGDAQSVALQSALNRLRNKSDDASKPSTLNSKLGESAVRPNGNYLLMCIIGDDLSLFMQPPAAPVRDVNTSIFNLEQDLFNFSDEVTVQIGAQKA